MNRTVIMTNTWILDSLSFSSDGHFLWYDDEMHRIIFNWSIINTMKFMVCILNILIIWHFIMIGMAFDIITYTIELISNCSHDDWNIKYCFYPNILYIIRNYVDCIIIGHLWFV